MKPAQYWTDRMPRHNLAEFVTTIQADAYRAGMLRAAELCRNVASIHSNPSIIEEWTQAAERIEAEAQKGLS